MANNLQPKIGDWYQSVNGDRFEIVATEEQESVLEIQHFDGAIEEIDIDSWKEMEVRPIEAPEDWSGSVDMDPDDYIGRKEGDMPPGFHDPLEFLHKKP